jgi:hypothetical protein
MKVKDIYTESVKEQFATKLTEAKAKLGKLKEGQMKQMMHKDAERLSREKFLDKYPGDGAFWDNINKDLDEGFEKSGVRADKKKGKIEKSTRKQYFVKLEKDGKMKGMTVTADEGENSSAVADRVARDVRSTGWSVAGIRAKDTVDEAAKGQDIADKSYLKTAGKKPGVMSKAVDTAKQAGKWLAGKGGPGKEGPTYEAVGKKAKKDYDGDGKIETGKDEYMGSRMKAAGKKVKEAQSVMPSRNDPAKKAAAAAVKPGTANPAMPSRNTKLPDDQAVKEASKKAKPDFLDMDKDGNKKEPMKKAVADKKKETVKESVDLARMKTLMARLNG